MSHRVQWTVGLCLLLSLLSASSAVGEEAAITRVRFATFNVSLNRRVAGHLATDLESRDNEQAKNIAEIIQRVRPHVLLLNEFDYDNRGVALDRFVNNYLAAPQREQEAIRYRYQYVSSVNTGLPSGHDLDNDGKTEGPGDAFGFGYFPGQYGMLVLSQFPIAKEQVRTFQTFLWRDMPNALLPQTPNGPFYEEAELAILRLSSKSVWDLPIQVADQTIHFVCAHPTPPVFDGPEDRNGYRNHDEIRFLADYVSQQSGSYIYDDNQRREGLSTTAKFIIAGDMNADPLDGDSTNAAIKLLLSHPRINARAIPTSQGAADKSSRDGGANLRQQGDPAQDTSDFNDRNVGNLRLDYVLPSKNLKVIDAGVFWPAATEPNHELIDASDHRLTWIDVEL